MTIELVRSILVVGGFGALGAAARYLLDLYVGGWWNSPFPISTLGINIGGSLLIGLFAELSAKGFLSPTLQLGLLVGLLGGFTTFSSYSLQMIQLLREGRAAMAILYFATTPLLGVAAAWIGIRIVQISVH